jgi:hypothetical protein
MLVKIGQARLINFIGIPYKCKALHCTGVFSLVFENTSQSGRSFLQMKGPSTYRIQAILFGRKL